MTGKDIVEALSFVDERYIEEAEQGTIPKTNNLRYLLPLAACLCLFLLGLRFQTPAPESAPEAATETNSASMHRPEMAPDLEIMEMHKDSSVIVESDVPVEGIMEPEMGEAHSVILRIVSWTDHGAEVSGCGVCTAGNFAESKNVRRGGRDGCGKSRAVPGTVPGGEPDSGALRLLLGRIQYLVY